MVENQPSFLGKIGPNRKIIQNCEGFSMKKKIFHPLQNFWLRHWYLQYISIYINRTQSEKTFCAVFFLIMNLICVMDEVIIIRIFSNLYLSFRRFRLFCETILLAVLLLFCYHFFSSLFYYLFLLKWILQNFLIWHVLPSFLLR